MEQIIADMLRELGGQSDSDHFRWICEDFVAAVTDIKEIPHSQWLAPIVAFIEAHPDADYGSPGPLVHFVERVRDDTYPRLLADSMSRRPNPHTLWLVQRLLNGQLNQGQRHALLAALESVVATEELPQFLRKEAASFLQHQANNR